MVRKSSPPASTGIAPTDCAPSTSTGTPVCSRSSRTGSTRPVVQSTCESASRRVRGVTAARIASGSASTTTTRAPLACRGPSRPKCSSRVVTISSSGPSSSPARTMLQPSVVEPVSDTCSAGTPTSDPSAVRASARNPSIRSKYSFPKRPCSSSVSSWARTASAVGWAIGPNVPAFRYASRSSTGKRARASSGVIRSSPPPGRGPRARRHCDAAARPARRRAARPTARARARGRSPGRPRTSPASSGMCSARRLKSPARMHGSAPATAGHERLGRARSPRPEPPGGGSRSWRAGSRRRAPSSRTAWQNRGSARRSSIRSVRCSSGSSPGASRIAFACPARAERKSPLFSRVIAPPSQVAEQGAARHHVAHASCRSSPAAAGAPRAAPPGGRARPAGPPSRDAPSPRAGCGGRAGACCRGRGSSCGRA